MPVLAAQRLKSYCINLCLLTISDEYGMWTILRPDAQAVLKDKKAQASLGRYFAVMQDEKPTKFLIAKKIPAEFGQNDSTEELWRRHENLTVELRRVEGEIDRKKLSLNTMPAPEKSYLDLKVEIANRILSSCHFCTRRCKVNRRKGEVGTCKCGTEITVSSIFEHVGEEPELVPS